MGVYLQKRLVLLTTRHLTKKRHLCTPADRSSQERQFPVHDYNRASVEPRQLDLPGPTIIFAGCGRPGGESVRWSREGLYVDGFAGQGVAEKADGREDAGRGGAGSGDE